MSCLRGQRKGVVLLFVGSLCVVGMPIRGFCFSSHA